MHSVGRKVAKARVLKRNLGTTRTNNESGKARVSSSSVQMSEPGLSRTIFSRDEVRGYLTPRFPRDKALLCIGFNVHAACLTRSASMKTSENS